ncbi:MAG: PDZ domain-containing protein [bacterium]
MNKILIRLLFAIPALLLATSIVAQEIQASGQGEIFMIPELSALLREQGEVVKVEMAMPVDTRPKAYKAVDVKSGDIVLYLNGTRIKTLKIFTSIYDSLQAGELVEIGLKRGDMRFISSFKKADPKNMPKRKMMMMTSDGKEISTEDLEGGGQRMAMRANSLETDMDALQPVIELGIILGSKDGVIQVARKLPIPVEGLGETEFQKGDVFTMLNGKKLESLAQFTEMFGKLKVGDKVDLQYEHEKKALKASFAKPKARGRMKIRTDRNEY